MKRYAALFALLLCLTLAGCGQQNNWEAASALTLRPVSETTAAPSSTPAPEADRMAPPTPAPEVDETPTLSPTPTSEAEETPTPAPSDESESPTDAQPQSSDEPERDLSAAPSSEGDEAVTSYVLNANTKKFHYPTCSSVKDIKPENAVQFTGTRSQAISQGYVPCKRCKP